MKEGWKEERLDKLCVIKDKYRKPITKSKRVSGPYPYYGATGLLDYVKEYIFDEKLVLLGEDGAKWGAGEISAYSIEGKTWVNNHAHVLAPKENLLDKWLIYYLNFADLSDYITGVTVPKLNQEKMSSIQIPLPPLPEQQRIVEYLDSTFAEIDALKAKAAEEVANAKAMFDAALREEMTPKEGWEEKTLGEISDVKGGKRVPKGYQLTTIPTSHKYIRVADFKDNGSINVDDLLYITDEIFEQIKRYTITSEDVYISIAGTIGKSGIIPKELDGANLTENACKLVLKPEINKVFVYLYTLSSLFKEQIMQYTKTSAQPKLALTRLANVLINYPPLEQQEAIVARLDTLRALVTSLEQKYAKITAECDALKQAILKQVFE